MRFSPVFLKTRTIVLGSLSLASLLWAVLLCVMLFSQGEELDVSARSLVLVMLATHTISTVILLILLIVTFRPWLDAARIMFLLMAHIGTAGTFAYWYPRFKCLSQDPGQEGVCKLIIAYILIASWLVPILLMIYGAGLALMVWRHRISASETPLVVDEESHAQCPLSIPQETTIKATFSRPISSWEHVSNVSSSSRCSEPLSTKKSLTLENDSPAAARLSKPPPAFHF